MMSLKPYVYLWKRKENRYRVNVFLQIPHGFDISRLKESRDASTATTRLEMVLIALNKQTHAAPRSFLRNLKLAQDNDRVEVAVVTHLTENELPPQYQESGALDFLDGPDEAEGPRQLGICVASTIGAETGDDDRDPMDKENQSDDED